MPEVPDSIIHLYHWITYLTPIWVLLVAIFWKPIRNLFTKEKNRLTTIENQLIKVQEDLDERKSISRALLHHEIFQTARTAIENGYITEIELENLETLYEPYKNLGGNGTAERLYKECQELPHKKTE